MRGGAVVLHYREKVSSGAAKLWELATIESTTHQPRPKRVENAAASSSDDPKPEDDEEQPEAPITKKSKKNSTGAAAGAAALA
eukprot:5283957-Heterocapsa_arctica.AAC.1